VCLAAISIFAAVFVEKYTFCEGLADVAACCW